MELLSPAGDMSSLKTAVGNGADAVYIGAQNFSARNLAENFEDVAGAVSRAHHAGVKLYLALNTLVRDRELRPWIDTAKNAVASGVDAFIVQDLGCAMLLKELCPAAVLHASTQMTAHNTSNVRMLQTLGFERVVLARELSFSEICKIKNNTDIELEIFVHGALCACYSGQCLMSSMFGARSANRGLCAQPCRLDYKGNGKSGRLLSPRDLCLIDHLEKLRQAGITSVKIEGRMKPAQYVGTVTRIYRKALDGGTITKQDRDDLLQAFSRRGFTDHPFAASIPASLPQSPSVTEKKQVDPRQTFNEYIPLKKGKRKKPRKLAAQVLTAAQAKAVLPLVDILYVPTGANWTLELKNENTQIVAAHPLISHDNEVRETAFPFDADLFGTLMDTNAPHKIADATMNVMNGETLRVLRSLGYERATVSTELNAAQIADLPNILPTEVIAYGRLTLMTTMHCPMRCDKKNCPAADGKAFLTDRMNKKFPVLKTGSGCRVSLLNSEPIYMADKLSMLSANVLRLVFTIETPPECVKLVKKYRDAMNGGPHPSPQSFTRGHFTRGVK